MTFNHANLQTNSFKISLLDNQMQLGLWLSMANAYCAEIAANSAYDWLLIDGEHAPNDISSLLAQLQAIAPYSSHPIVRPVNSDPALIKQILDIGAQTLLIPMVNTAQQAQEIVSAMHYPPKGIRGVGASIARASRWGKIPNYLQQAEDGLCLLIQIETQQGLENLDDILSVTGIDGVFIGPADLSASLGYLDQSDHPDMQTIIISSIKRIRNAGKAAGILATSPHLAKIYIEAGANFVAIAVDSMLLGKALDDALEIFRPSSSPHPIKAGY